MLTRDSQLLLEKYPELIKEISVEFAKYSDMATKESKINYWQDFEDKEQKTTCPTCGSTTTTKNINTAQIYKKKCLFYTEDGKEIFEGDTVFTVFTHSEFGFPLWTVTEWKGISSCNWDESVKVFSNKSNSETYILENKPCLSANDFMKNFESVDKERIFQKLRELVKTKTK